VWPIGQGCSLGLELLGLEAFFERLGLVSASYVSYSRLHRTSKFKLRTITIKFSILYRDTWAA